MKKSVCEHICILMFAELYLSSNVSCDCKKVQINEKVRPAQVWVGGSVFLCGF